MKEHPVDVEVQLLLKRTPENHLEILINHRSFLMFKEKKLLPPFLLYSLVIKTRQT